MMTTTEMLTATYDTLFVEDFVSNGKIAKQLNAMGHPNKTVCPECGVDDFMHVDGCSKVELIENI